MATPWTLTNTHRATGPTTTREEEDGCCWSGCRHIVADDLATGTRVCLNCGRVFDVLLFGDDDMAPPVANHHTAGNNSCCDRSTWEPLIQQPRVFANDVLVRECLLDSLAHLQMNNGYFVDRVMGALHQIANTYEEKDNETWVGRRYIHLSVKLEKDRGRLAYVVWDTMMAEHCPRAPGEVAYTFNTTTQHMLAAEKELCRQSAFSPLADYVPRLVAELHLPGWVSLAVEKAAWYVYDHLAHPEPMIGAILLVLGDMLKPNTPGVSHMLTLPNIATTVGCTEHRLLELRRRLPTGVTAALKRALRRGAANHLGQQQLAHLLSHQQAKGAQSRTAPSMSYH